MTLAIIVFCMAAALAVLVIVCLVNADENELHDEAIYYRWEDLDDSEPPEWADPVKWYESQGRKEEVELNHVEYEPWQMGYEK
jgi:hypothetical protein